MESFDLEILSLVLPGYKAIDQHTFDNSKEHERLNKIAAETYLIRIVPGDITCQNYKKLELSLFTLG